MPATDDAQEHIDERARTAQRMLEHAQIDARKGIDRGPRRNTLSESWVSCSASDISEFPPKRAKHA